FVQGGADDRRGPGRDLSGVEGLGESLTTGRDFLAGYSGPGQDIVREGEPAPCFADPDPQPGPEELRRVPVPIIQNTATTTSTSTTRFDGASGGCFTRTTTGSTADAAF
ncbi:hypothetical protein, partial [Paenarthrobacter sp. TAF1]|uniref:hypothetical protein n=1 Tax=Paenarthrobacter sp. TAF1 TaxID=3233067 RepID=UPI003F9889FB